MVKAVLLLEKALEGPPLRKGDLVQQTDDLGSVTAEGRVAADSSGSLVDVLRRGAAGCAGPQAEFALELVPLQVYSAFAKFRCA